jgi:hypothetical protein
VRERARGRPRYVIEAELFGDRTLQVTTTPDGITVEVSQFVYARSGGSAMRAIKRPNGSTAIGRGGRPRGQYRAAPISHPTCASACSTASAAHSGANVMNEREIRAQIAALEAMLRRRGRGRPKGTAKLESGTVEQAVLAEYLDHKIKFIRKKGPHGADAHARRMTAGGGAPDEALRKRLGGFAKVTDLPFLEFVASEIQRTEGEGNRWVLIEKGRADVIMDDSLTWILAVAYGKSYYPLLYSEIAYGTNDGKKMIQLQFPDE